METKPKGDFCANKTMAFAKSYVLLTDQSVRIGRIDPIEHAAIRRPGGIIAALVGICPVVLAGGVFADLWGGDF